MPYRTLNPLRPRTLTDLVAQMLQAQEDSGDPPDSQVYVATFANESPTIIDSATTTLHSSTYLYDDADAIYGLATYS